MSVEKVFERKLFEIEVALDEKQYQRVDEIIRSTREYLKTYSSKKESLLAKNINSDIKQFGIDCYNYGHQGKSLREFAPILKKLMKEFE